MSKQIDSISDLVPDSRNANKGTPRGLGMVEKSLRDYGAGRSILIDKNGVVIAGNKTLEAAVNAGFEEIQVVQSDGKKLMVVQREDIDINTVRGRKLAIADNRTSEVGIEWDAGVIGAFLDEGVKLDDMFLPDELSKILDSFEVPDFAFKEYDETAADDLEYCECPSCGHKFPK